ncbi:MAG: aminotransferase class V-fold PLP-dependent enzyme [Aureispira sp.]|nr:aminotransferase class V-fold PLP-dependent enzyme [Aureispira sp.]
MLQSQKHLFSLREGAHYLNCAYKAPLLKSADQAALKALMREQNPMDIGVDDFFDEADEVRALFGTLVNCSASEVAIIPAVSYGISSVLNNISCKKGQHALIVENEFPSSYFAIQRWCKNQEAELKIVQPDINLELIGADWNERILNSISSQTAVVLMSSIHWMNGLKFDLEAIGKKCKSVGAKFIVDGSQSVGAMPIDVKKLHIDALICAGYKWLLGPYSISLAYIGETFNNGIPLEEAWMNRKNARDFSNLTDYCAEYTPDAGRYNVGQRSNFILMAMLKEALIQLNEWTAVAIQEYAKGLIQPLLQYLDSMEVQLEPTAYFSNHLFGLKLPNSINTTTLKENLTANQIYLSVRGSSLRVSSNVFNTKEDINRLIEVIKSS